MSTIPATIIDRPTVTKRAGAIVRAVSACMEGIARYLAFRAAIKSLHELDDRALKDIGLVRPHIEAAVRGCFARSDRARM